MRTLIGRRDSKYHPSAPRILSLFLLTVFMGLALRARAAGNQEEISALRECLAHLSQADILVNSGNLDAAQQEYLALEKLSGIPQHFLQEAQQGLEEIQRRGAGQPSVNTNSSRLHLLAVAVPAVVVHVAVTGNDSNPGTPDHPFASLERARDALRRLKAPGPGSRVVVIHGGDYPVTRTFRLTAEDCGTAESPVIYRAAEGETVRFRGGVCLTGFKPVQQSGALKKLSREARPHVVELDLRRAGVTNLLPLELGGFASGRGFRTHPAHELFFNGKAMTLARGPNEGFVHIADVAVKDGTKGYDRTGSKVGKFSYEGDLPSRWASEPDLLLYGYWFWDWADSYERVASIDPEKRLITLGGPWHNYGYSIGAPFYAVNALCELDAPGEYYIDRTNLYLFFYPPSNPDKATIELSVFAKPMVTLEDVSHVRFERVTWELGCADGILVRGGSNCLFTGCVVRQFAGNGIEIRGGANHGLLSCDVYSMGRGGTVIAGGERKTLRPGGHFVENCDIHDLSRIDHTYTPAVLLEGVGNRLAHNRLHDVLSSAMRVEGNDHTIEYNEVFNAVLESDDQGGADMFGNPTYRGNIYRFNYWHDIGNWRDTGPHPKCGQAGIRLDDAICGTLIYGNVFEHCSHGKTGFGGVQIHGGKDNIVDNNLFIDCAAAVSFSPWAEDRWHKYVSDALNSDEIDKTFYLKRYPALALLSENPNSNLVCRNLLIRGDEILRHAPKNLQALQNTTLSGGDVALRPENPSLNRPGFARIPVEQIGLYQDEFRRRVTTR